MLILQIFVYVATKDVVRFLHSWRSPYHLNISIKSLPGSLSSHSIRQLFLWVRVRNDSLLPILIIYLALWCTPLLTIRISLAQFLAICDVSSFQWSKRKHFNMFERIFLAVTSLEVDFSRVPELEIMTVINLSTTKIHYGECAAPLKRPFFNACLLHLRPKFSVTSMIFFNVRELYF